MIREEEFQSFCNRMLNAENAPLKDFDRKAPLVAALLDVFKAVSPEQEVPQIQNFNAAPFNLPCVAYIIRNVKSNRLYVGSTEKTFNERYGGMGWWNSIKNHEICRDVLVYGLGAFHVSIYPAKDGDDARLKEAELISRNLTAVYNERPESLTG